MRKRSSSITPTYSTDRALLLSRYTEAPRTVTSHAEARDAVLQWGIGTDPTFKRRSNLNTEEDWSAFVESCTIPETQGGEEVKIDLDQLLKKCYSVAFSMPMSPSANVRRSPKFKDSESPGANELPSPLSI